MSPHERRLRPSSGYSLNYMTVSHPSVARSFPIRWTSRGAEPGPARPAHRTLPARVRFWERTGSCGPPVCTLRYGQGKRMGVLDQHRCPSLGRTLPRAMCCVLDVVGSNRSLETSLAPVAPVAAYSSEIQQPVRATAALGRHPHTQ